MDKVEKLIKEYLESEMGLDRANKTPDCPNEQILLEYLNGVLDREKCQFIEHHISDCGFCLSQLNLASQSQLMDKQGSFSSVSQILIDKTKSSLGVSENVNSSERNKTRTKKARFFLAGAIIFFIFSFIFPKYFIQFLVVTLILGMRWVFESEGGRTLIMVFDSWRRHSHDDDDDSSNRSKNRVKSYHK